MFFNDCVSHKSSFTQIIKVMYSVLMIEMITDFCLRLIHVIDFLANM